MKKVLDVRHKFRFNIYVQTDTIGKRENYLVWSRVGHHNERGLYKYERLCELVRACENWVDGLHRDLFEDVKDNERVVVGKFNPHYRWNHEYKAPVWVPIDSVSLIGYTISKVKVVSWFGKEREKENVFFAVARQENGFEEKGIEEWVK